jgi:hypothetical protein
MPAPAAMPERAAPPAIPAATRQQQRDLADRTNYYRERENIERRRQLRGLLVLALLVIVLNIARGGLGRVFPPSWWHLW